MAIERSDGVNYAPLMVRKPQTAPDGTPLAPRNIFQTEGFTDTYSPNPAIEAFATALGGDLVQLPDAKEIAGRHAARPRDRADADHRQRQRRHGGDSRSTSRPATATVTSSCSTSARRSIQSTQFLGTLAATGKATVVSP